LSEVDESSLSKRTNQSTGLCVQRVNAVAHEVEDSFTGGPLPIRHTAIAQSNDLAIVVRRRIEHPDLTPRCRIECDSFQRRRRDVHDPVHYDWIRVHRRSLVCVASVIFPGGLQPVHIRRVNLRHRDVLIALCVAAVHRPVNVLVTSGGKLIRARATRGTDECSDDYGQDAAFRHHGLSSGPDEKDG
jgi:hypothetical protein